MNIPRSLLTGLSLVVGAILTTTASFAFGIPWLMPILGAIVPYPLYLLHVSRDRFRAAFGWVLFWAVCHSLTTIGATLLAPQRAAAVILKGVSYTQEMLHWLRTGEGAEGSLRLFLPIHLLHYSLFSLLSFLTLGAAALLLGTWLLNYMNYYVAQISQLSANPLLVGALAWYPWSLLRVIAYIATGIALTALGLRLWRRNPRPQFPQSYLILGMSLVVADIIVKALLAPYWRLILLNYLQ
jgi:hypothetical protein